MKKSTRYTPGAKRGCFTCFVRSTIKTIAPNSSLLAAHQIYRKRDREEEIDSPLTALHRGRIRHRRSWGEVAVASLDLTSTDPGLTALA